MTSELDVSEIAPPARYEIDSDVGVGGLKTLNHGYTSGYTDVTRAIGDKRFRATADDEDDKETEIIREIVKDSSGSSTGSKKKKKTSKILIDSGGSAESKRPKRSSIKPGSRSRLEVGPTVTKNDDFDE